MTVQELIQEGQRLARPCVHLRPKGKDYCAVWGGRGVVPLRDGRFRHWISFEARALPEPPSIGGCLSVYANREDCVSGLVLIDPQATLPRWTGGTKLYAHPAASLPPLEAVFPYGEAPVQTWLEANQWRPEWGYNGNFPDRGPAEAYDRAYHNQLDLDGQEVYAVLGGWHMPWPDGDWEELVKSHLLLWTFRDSEPWVEVWQNESVFRVIQRIT